MFREQTGRLLSRYGHWRLIQAVLIAAIAALVAAIVLTLVIPVRLGPADDLFAPVNVSVAGDFSGSLDANIAEFQEFAQVIRSGLFKLENERQDGGIAQKTIERILSQLTLRGILRINGEFVAYVDVKGEGLEKCTPGTKVGELFTVLNVNENSVEISIIGHTHVLSL